METKMEQIDVKKIMEEIRNEIREKGYSPDELSFKDVSIPEVCPENNENNALGLTAGIMEAAACQRVDLYYPLSGNALKKIIKKVLRKLIGLVLVPVTLEQDRYNAIMVRNMQIVQNHIEDQQREIEALKRQVNELEAQIEEG